MKYRGGHFCCDTRDLAGITEIIFVTHGSYFVTHGSYFVTTMVKHIYFISSVIPESSSYVTDQYAYKMICLTTK